MRCSVDAVLMSGDSPLTVTLSSTAPTSRSNVRRTLCAAPSEMPLEVCVLNPAERDDERIGAAGNVVEDELTGGARHLALDDAGVLVGQFDVGAGQDASRCVDHDAGEGRRGPLRPRRHAQTKQ